MRQGVADKARRIERLNQRWNQIQQVIAARSESKVTRDAPGGKTGLVIQATRALGQGKALQQVPNYEVGISLLREERAIAEQAARELGQWTEKRDVTSSDEKLEGPGRVAIYLPEPLPSPDPGLPPDEAYEAVG